MPDKEIQRRYFEEALVALTFVSYNSEPDREKANRDLAPVFESYTDEQLGRGATFALTMVLEVEARREGKTLEEKIAEVRQYFLV